MTTVSVDELQRAWAAVAAGEFRTRTASRRAPSTGPWEPSEPVIVVAGASGRAGASTVAVALAAAAHRQVRVIECASMHTSGLAAATSAELGVTDAGWRQGTRERVVLIERTTTSIQDLGGLPAPEPSEADLSVVDVGWDLSYVMASGGWLAALLKTAPLVLVTAATVPGLRALDTAVHLAGRADQTWCAVVGPRRARWPQPLRLAVTASIAALDERGRLLTVPQNPTLALHGVTPDPLPPRLVTAVQPLLDQLVDPTEGTDDDVQH